MIIATQLVNPNLHVILIHVPIAMLFVGTAIEVLAFLWPRSTFRAAGRWMILIGALAAIPASTSGMVAAKQAMSDEPLPWHELKQQAKLSPEQWDLLSDHVLYNAIAAGVLALLVVAWLGASDRIRAKAHYAFLLLLIVGVGLIAAGAWHGGELVYAHKTGTGLVESGWPKSDADVSTTQTAEAPAGGNMAFAALNKTGKFLEKVDTPIDLHATLAGWMAAFALAAMGISIRGLWLAPRVTADDSLARDDDIIGAIAGRQQAAESRGFLTRESPAAPATPVRIPAARFWLLVVLLGIVTALLGWMMIGPGSMEDVTGLFEDPEKLRHKAHGLAAGAMIVSALILALFTRVSPGNKLLIGGFSLLLVLALAIQIWIGVLLTFDTHEGGLLRFNAPATSTSP